MDEIMGTADAARYLRMKLDALKQRSTRKTGPDHMVIGNRAIYKRAELDRWGREHGYITKENNR